MQTTERQQLYAAGGPDPLDFRRHREVLRAFTPGEALSATAPTIVILPIAGALAVRLRGIITTTEAAPPSPMGVLSFAYLRPAPHDATAYAASLEPPAGAESIVKGTEFLVDIAPGGESLLEVTFTPDAGVDPGETISTTFLDVMQQ